MPTDEVARVSCPQKDYILVEEMISLIEAQLDENILHCAGVDLIRVDTTTTFTRHET